MAEVVIVTSRSGFPNGHGAASILRKYATGFERLGRSCNIWLLKASESSQEAAVNSQTSGVAFGAHYRYLAGTVIASSARLHRGRDFARAIGTAVKNLAYGEAPELVLYYSPDDLCAVVAIGLICKVRGIRYVGVKTESSLVDRSRTSRLAWRARERWMYSLFDGFGVPTAHLESYVRSLGQRNVHRVRIPVDECMFHDSYPATREPVFAYMGTLGDSRELEMLLKCFHIASASLPQWRLRILGAFPTRELEEIVRDRVVRLGLGEHVDFLGPVPGERVPRILAGCSVMLLPRADGEHSRAGFPIKLGEYLMSGAPVVVTSTGEISEVLTDRWDCRLVTPGDVDGFAEAMVSCARDRELADFLGKNGIKTAMRHLALSDVCSQVLNL